MSVNSPEQPNNTAALRTVLDNGHAAANGNGAAPGGPQPTAEAIRSWIVERLARQLSIDPQDIDVREPFARYGLESEAAVSMAADLEAWLGRPVSPTLVYD